MRLSFDLRVGREFVCLGLEFTAGPELVLPPLVLRTCLLLSFFYDCSTARSLRARVLRCSSAQARVNDASSSVSYQWIEVLFSYLLILSAGTLAQEDNI